MPGWKKNTFWLNPAPRYFSTHDFKSFDVYKSIHQGSIRFIRWSAKKSINSAKNRKSIGILHCNRHKNSPVITTKNRQGVPIDVERRKKDLIISLFNLLKKYVFLSFEFYRVNIVSMKIYWIFYLSLNSFTLLSQDYMYI